MSKQTQELKMSIPVTDLSSTDWKVEVGTQRKEAERSIGHNALVGMPDGSIATQDEVQRMFDEQHEHSEAAPRR